MRIKAHVSFLYMIFRCGIFMGCGLDCWVVSSVQGNGVFGWVRRAEK